MFVCIANTPFDTDVDTSDVTNFFVSYFFFLFYLVCCLLPIVYAHDACVYKNIHIFKLY